MVDLLLEWRPALADQVDSSGNNPLHSASSDGNRNIVRAIMRAGPPRTVYRKDSCGLSALHVAARMGHHRVVEDMLGSFPDAAKLRDGDGATFVHAAAREKRSSVVSLAIKNPMRRGLLDAQGREHTAPPRSGRGRTRRRRGPATEEGKARADVLNKDRHTPFDLAAGSTSFFTMVSLVVTLVAFGAQLRPQRQDHLKKWSGRDIVHEIEKTSNSLAMVAVLIATSAFAAGFNLPGGYDDNGKKNLAGKFAFKSFLILDTVAVATSVVAVILLVYGKASRSTGSWKSFAAALQCMWVSLISLMLGFYTALNSVATTREVNRYGFMVIYTGICALLLCIATWIGPATTSRTICRFLWQRCHLKGRRHAVKRQFPLAGASVPNLFLFTATSSLAFVYITATRVIENF